MEQALAHPYFKDLHDADDEPVCETHIQIKDFQTYEEAIEEVKQFIDRANQAILERTADE